MTGDTLERLRNLSFLEGVELETMVRLAESATEALYGAGELILEEGSVGGDAFLIVEGRVEIVKGEDKVVVGEAGPGSLLGEMSFLEQRPRSATVRALETTRVLWLAEESLASLLAEQPQALYRTLQLLSARLRESSLSMIASLRRKNMELARAYAGLQAAQAALVEKERLERELELARELQRSILPDVLPRATGFQCAARYEPARHVSGDFYDAFMLDDGRLGLVMADATGKGMPAALYMALARSLIRAEARPTPSPRQVLLEVHRLLLEMSRAEMFLTVFYGTLDPQRRTLRYARAGHELPMIWNPSRTTWRDLDAGGMPLGWVEDVYLEEAETQLAPGELLVLYTDGMVHAEGPGGEFFGKARLRAAVEEAAGLGAGALCDRVFARVAEFVAGNPQFDDMALLVVETETTSLGDHNDLRTITA